MALVKEPMRGPGSERRGISGEALGVYKRARDQTNTQRQVRELRCSVFTDEMIAGEDPAARVRCMRCAGCAGASDSGMGDNESFGECMPDAGVIEMVGISQSIVSSNTSLDDVDSLR